MNITIVGAGYVGFSNAVVLAQKANVIVYDIDDKKVDGINNQTYFLNEEEIKEFVATNELSLVATTNIEEAYQQPDIVMLCLPTDYDPNANSFNVNSIIEHIKYIKENNINCPIIIKSTIYPSLCDEIKEKYQIEVNYLPEFLRETKSLHDNLNPHRIIVGGNQTNIQEFIDLYISLINNKDCCVINMTNYEASVVKLFCNNYLAMRVAYFNEVDTFCIKHNLDARSVVKAISLDPRIGDFYNNPSFGYGGYCLPKDVKALMATLDDDFGLLNNIDDANNKRKRFIAQQLVNKTDGPIGFYRLQMKKDSDNIRQSPLINIIEQLISLGRTVYIYEPILDKNVYHPQLQIVDDVSK